MRSEFTQDREESKAGKPRRPASLGRPLSPRAPSSVLLVLCPPTERGKATLLGTDSRPQSWLKSKVHFPHIASYTLNYLLQEARTNVFLHYCCNCKPRTMPSRCLELVV